jgi:putative hydrolase of HD superfamily
MQQKAANPIENYPPGAGDSLLRLYFEFTHLKQLYRQGWLRRGIPDQRCESVAEHSFAVAVLAMLLCDQRYPHLDSRRVVRMALVHDFAEIYAGDIIPADNLPAVEKQARERTAIERIVADMPAGEAYLALWEEFEAGATPEAQLVRQVDRLEMALQAAVYRADPDLGQDFDPGEFYASTRRALQDPALEALLSQLEQIFPAGPAGDQH